MPAGTDPKLDGYQVEEEGEVPTRPRRHNRALVKEEVVDQKKQEGGGQIQEESSRGSEGVLRDPSYRKNRRQESGEIDRVVPAHGGEGQGEEDREFYPGGE